MDKTDTFTHDGIEYDLTKVRIMVRPEKTFVLKVKDLEWVLQYDTPHEDRIAQARLRWPLLVTKWKGKWTVIDGIHRLERLRRKGLKLAPVKYVSPEVLNACRVL